MFRKRYQQVSLSELLQTSVATPCRNSHSLPEMVDARFIALPWIIERHKFRPLALFSL